MSDLICSSEPRRLGACVCPEGSVQERIPKVPQEVYRLRRTTDQEQTYSVLVAILSCTFYCNILFLYFTVTMLVLGKYIIAYSLCK